MGSCVFYPFPPLWLRSDLVCHLPQLYVIMCPIFHGLDSRTCLEREREREHREGRLVAFFDVATSPKTWKHAIRTRWLANPNQGHSQFPHSFWSLYGFTKMNILSCLFKWAYRSLWLYSLPVLSMQFTLCKMCVFLVSIFGATPNHMPLKYGWPNKDSKKVGVTFITARFVFLGVVPFLFGDWNFFPICTKCIYDYKSSGVKAHALT